MPWVEFLACDGSNADDTKNQHVAAGAASRDELHGGAALQSRGSRPRLPSAALPGREMNAQTRSEGSP